MRNIFEKVESVIKYVASAVLVIALFSMIALSLTQVILRNLFEGGFTWADIVIRNLVLWVGFGGAIVATTKGRHIAIGALIKFVPERANLWVHRIVSGFSVVVSIFLTYASSQFIVLEKEMGSSLVGSFPLWIAELIIPFTFFCMGVLFFFDIFDKEFVVEGEAL